MKAKIIYEIEVIVEIPDDLPEQVRELARELGENYVSVDATDQEIIERIGLIRGIRGLDHDESMTEELNTSIDVEVNPILPIEFQWLVGE